MDKPIQDYYPADTAICYGCGRNNAHGLHIKTYWDGATGRAKFTPAPEHTAFPGYVYGGLIASLIDCHSIGTAIAALYDLEDIDPASGDVEITCVTGRLCVDYLKPTPMGAELHLESRIQEITPRKAVVITEVYAGDTLTAKGETVAVRVPSRKMD